MPGLSLHVVDITRGQPAAGMWVEVFLLDAHRKRIADGQLGAHGTFDHAIARETLAIGTYEAVFHAGAFFTDPSLDLTDPPFLDLVPFRFNIADPAQHYHLPLKITPWGFSLFRGV
jgi:5-hydroxyisourate hydrolase